MVMWVIDIILVFGITPVDVNNNSAEAGMQFVVSTEN